MFDLQPEPDELFDVFIRREIWTRDGPVIQEGYGTIGDADGMDPGTLEEFLAALDALPRVVKLEPIEDEPF